MLVPVRKLVAEALGLRRLLEILLLLCLGLSTLALAGGTPLSSISLLIPIGMAVYVFIVRQRTWMLRTYPANGEFALLEIIDRRAVLKFATYSENYRLTWFHQKNDRWSLRFPYRFIRFWVVIPVDGFPSSGVESQG